MRGQLVIAEATGQRGGATPQDIRITADPSATEVRAALDAGHRFWLDLSELGPDGVALLRDTFAFHPLAVEDAEQFGQRAKISVFDTFVLLVAYGVGGEATAVDDALAADPVEMHFFLGEQFLVTVHRRGVPAVATTLHRLRDSGGLETPTMVLYRILDRLVDGYFPYLDAFDDAIDALQDDILRDPTNEQLGRLFALKRRLLHIRRLTSDQRDMLGTALTGSHTLPGLTPDAERYLRDVYDHLSRLAQSADGYRDLLSAALDTHLSTTSNRLNVVMKQLAIIATVFLPMSFLTGFFGQNFGWLVDRIGGSAVFWTAGVGLQVLMAGALLLMFRRMGWLGARPDE